MESFIISSVASISRKQHTKVIIMLNSNYSQPTPFFELYAAKFKSIRYIRKEINIV